jgi:two-component system, NtrC family, sensor kinase
MSRTDLAAQVEALRRRVKTLERGRTRSRRAEASLRESEARFRALFEHASDLIIAAALDGTIISVNRATEEALQWPRETLIGRNIRELITPESFALGEERMRRVLAGEKLPKTFGLEAVSRDGSVVPLEGWARLLRDAGGRPVGHEGVYRDITERRLAEETVRESEERYRSLVDNASDSILTFTLDGNITSVNRAYAKLTGWTTDELMGENWQTLVAPVDRERMAERTRRTLAGEKLPSIFEVLTLCKDGRVVQLEGRAQTMRTLHGTPVGFQGVYRDISERKRAEEALRESEESYRLMFQEAEDARAVLDRLYRVTSSMQMSWEREDRLRAFEQGVHEALGFDRFYVALASPDLQTLDVATAVGVEMFESLPLSPAAGPFYHVFQTRRPLAVLSDDDLRRLPLANREYLERPYMRSRRFIVVPLLAGDRVIGVASADNKTTGRPITPVHVELFNLLCQQLATALEEARLYAEARAREQEVATRNRELTEALEQQTATSEILRVISQSQTDVQPVFDTIARNAVRLCAAAFAMVFRFDGMLMHLVAHDNLAMEGLEALERQWPMRPERRSVPARAVLDRSVVHVHDVLTEPDNPYLTTSRALGIRTVLIVPMLREGLPIGAIAVYRQEVEPFSDQQIALVGTFASQAVIAIENTRLLSELRARTGELTRSVEQLTALGEISRAVSSTLDVETVLDTIGSRATQLAGADGCAIYEYDEATQTFHVRATHNFDTAFVDTLRAMPLRKGEGVMGRATETREPIQIADIAMPGVYQSQVRDVLVGAGFRAVVSVPLLREEQIIGSLSLIRKAPGEFSPEVIDVLKTFATQSALAIQNARLFREIEAKSRELGSLSRDMEQLYRLSTTLQEPLSLKEQLRRVLEEATRMGLLDRIYVWAMSPEGDRLVNLAGAGFAEDEWKDFEDFEIPLVEAGAMYKAFREGRPLLFDDDKPLSPDLYLKPQYLLKGLRTNRFLVIPMIARGQTVGVFAGDNKPSGRQIPPGTAELLQTFASHAAVAIANARLFQTIEDKSRELELAGRHKSEFLANMSHELRTPLNAIIGFSEVLSEGMFGDINEKQTEYLGDILEAGRHLLSLINDILDLSKIEAGRMELESADFDLPSAIENALILVRERASRRGIALQRTIDERLGMIRADERKVKQVLLNLLSNALKFTSEGGRIDVRTRLRDDVAEISVSDTGVGIAPEDQEAVFEEFRQVGAAEKKAEGTGLGLALSRKFIELHGGRIWVKSQVGVGSTFTFTLPVRRGE